MAQEKVYPKSRDIINLLGIGLLLTTSIFIPGVGIAAGKFYRNKEQKEFKNSQKEWQKFNNRLLRRNLKRLHQQKIIDFLDQNGEQVIKLTDRGKSKFLQLKFQSLSEDRLRWDGRWRIIIYDVALLKKSTQQTFRRTLQKSHFLLLQKSVYLTPYPCKDSVQYLREFFGLREEVIYLEVSNLENESIYKKYFGI